MAAKAQHYDRDAEDLGNIVGLEHVNLQIPDQSLGTAFYISGLGLTRDPYMNTGLANMWVNVGKSQFHLPTGEPWVLRGAISLGMPYLEFDVPMGTAKGITKFYRKIFGAKTCVDGKDADRVARVGV